MRAGEIPLLCVVVLVVMVGASALHLYPLGGIHQLVFVGPVLFVAIGHAFEDALTLWRPRPESAPAVGGRLLTALAALAAGVVAIAGTSALMDTDPHAYGRIRAEILVTLEREVRDDDIVYFSTGSVPTIMFYNETKPDNYHYGSFCTWGSAEDCVGELSNLPLSGTGRLWLVMLQRGGKPIHRWLEIWERRTVFRSLGSGDAGFHVSRRGLRADELALSDDPS